MNKRWFRVLFRRRVIISALIVIQTAFLIYPVVAGSQLSDTR